jgi:cell division protein FtsI (penicillin-binding protein 3)
MLKEFNANPRIRILAIAIVVLMAVFVMRLFYLQVIEHDKYVALAQQEQQKRLIIPAMRGEIYMKDGDGLAKVVMNQTVYTMFVDPSIMDDEAGVRKAIKEIVGGNVVARYEERLDDDTQYVRVATEVTRTQAQLVKKRGLKGVGFQAESKRVYPEKTLAAQTLGFLDAEGRGKYGVEEQFDTELEGKDGLLQSVTDVANVPLTIGNDNIDIPAQNGENIALTLDRNIQAYTETALLNGIKRSGATNGSAIVMDPQTGKILAMTSLPTYNPGEINKIPSFSVVNNGVVSSPYEPGSVMKTFTMATAIDTGTIKPSDTFVNTDYVTVDDRVISNATKGQVGTITFQHALNYSLNTGMVEASMRLGGGSLNDRARSTMYRYLHDKFRLGEKTNIQLPYESAGRIIPPSDVEGNAVRYSNMSFGQGMDLTMVQVAASFSAMMNGGTYYHPTVIEGRIDSDGELVRSQAQTPVRGIIKSSTSETIRAMVTKARRAFYASNDRPGYQVGGKTGTSQTIVNGSYENGQTVGTYLGFGGDSKPRYVIMVQVSGQGENLAGGDDAMPIFTDISNWMIDYLTLQPRG